MHCLNNHRRQCGNNMFLMCWKKSTYSGFTFAKCIKLLSFCQCLHTGYWGGVWFGFYCYFFKGALGAVLSDLETTVFLLSVSDACGGIHPR